MRKKIAFLAGAISFDNQNRVIDGVLRRAALVYDSISNHNR